MTDISLNTKKTNQKDLETIFSNTQLLLTIKKEFTEITKDPFGLDLLTQLYLHKQASVETLVGILSPKYGNPQEVADKLYAATIGIDIDKDKIGDDLGDYNYDTEMFITKYDLTDDVKDRLDKYQYPLPMIIEPNKVNSNFDTGYETIKNLVVLNGNKRILAYKDLCLDHINRANKVALTFNFDLINSYIHEDVVRKPNEDFDDYKLRKRQSDVFYNSSLEVMDGIASLTDSIYLTHKYDRRGRCYASGYHVNTQGTDYNKAVLELVNKELIS